MEHFFGWWTGDYCSQCGKHRDEIISDNLSCNPLAVAPVAVDEPETQEQYEERRKALVEERIKKDLLGENDLPKPLAPGENLYERAKLDVYPRPTF